MCVRCCSGVLGIAQVCAVLRRESGWLSGVLKERKGTCRLRSPRSAVADPDAELRAAVGSDGRSDRRRFGL